MRREYSLGQALKRSAFINLIGFSATTLMVATVSIVLREAVSPVLLFRMFITFTVLFLILTLKMRFKDSKWAYDKPYIVTDLIFMPLQWLTVALGIVLFNGFIIGREIIILLLLFPVVFFIVLTIRYLYLKSGTDRMNAALDEFKKESRSYGDEE